MFRKAPPVPVEDRVPPSQTLSIPSKNTSPISTSSKRILKERTYCVHAPLELILGFLQLGGASNILPLIVDLELGARFQCAQDEFVSFDSMIPHTLE